MSKLIGNAKIYWKTPPLGYYMTYKEIASYSVGGIGWFFIVYVIQQLQLSVGNFITGNVIGIKMTHIYALYVVAMIASFPATALRANIIDNTRNRKGKYRPYLITMGIPTCILAIGFVWAPYEYMSYWMKCATVLFFNIGFQFIYMFFYDAYENLIYVLSPNTQERTNVAAIKSIVYSLAPSIMGFIMPIASKWITNERLDDMKLYRVMYPPVVIIGMFITILAYANTQEKIIQAKTHHVQMKFIDTLRAVIKNKYFWIISAASWVGYLEVQFVNILTWTYNYRRPCSAEVYALIFTIYGNSALWGMLLAPFCIKKWGKKNVLIVTNTLNIFFIASLYPIIIESPSYMIWLMLCSLYLNGIVTNFAKVLEPSTQGDIRDYQQYITGERIDGMFSAVGLIGTVFTTVISLIPSVAYEKAGINSEHFYALKPQIEAAAAQYGATIYDAQGNPNLYSVLYDRNTFNSVITVMISISVISALFNVIPYFFYDLTEIKQKGIVKILKVRAMFEDYGNNALSDKELVEGIDLIRKSREYAAMESRPVTNKELKKLKKTLPAEEYKKAKEEYKKDKDTAVEIETSKLLMSELSKFETDEFKEKVAIAQKIYDGGLQGLYTCDPEILKNARKMSKNTKEEKRYRSECISSAKDRLRSVKLLKKYYPDSIEEFDFSVFEKLYEREDEIDALITEAYGEFHAAKDRKDEESAKLWKEQIKTLKAEKRKAELQIKKATDESSIYSRCAKPYNDARRLLNQKENYSRYEEIVAMYDEAKTRADEEAAKEEEERLRLEEEEKAYALKLTQEREARKKAKKND
ncbi:MAG: MFS transporter [Acutalibacteraceae bacterium]|nr:MFS transporter [Oscillospiraceae bacterium]